MRRLLNDPGTMPGIWSSRARVWLSAVRRNPRPPVTINLLKERVSDIDELADAVRRVALGGRVLDPSVVALLVGRKRVHNPLDGLTEREREVLSVMAEGRSDQAICEQLHLSPKTIEAYVRGVFTKLGLYQGVDDNRRVLAVLAFLRG